MKKLFLIFNQNHLLAQLELMSSHFITSCLGEGTDPRLATLLSGSFREQ